MRYNIRHITRFAYESPVSESVMEVRMHPRSEGQQRCLQFGLTTSPASRVLAYQDCEGNSVHHFNIPAAHTLLTVTMEAVVDCDAPRPLPYRLGPAGWAQLDALTSSGAYWDYVVPSVFARPSQRLEQLRAEIGLERGNDPIVMLRRLMGEIYKRFEYAPQTTRVDSPIDDALKERRGVCQDFAHIFIALVRPLGVPARYVSGYLFGDAATVDRSADGATHAWVDALLPDIGWVGFDPTNNLIAADRHIRAAVGRDYFDVPPTRGIYKGTTDVHHELAVSVRVAFVGAGPPITDAAGFTVASARRPGAAEDGTAAARASQQQQ